MEKVTNSESIVTENFDFRDWMDGPMEKVNPDNVEQEVGNFWRGLYKLEKNFDSVPLPKRIAQKVHVFAFMLYMLDVVFQPFLVYLF